MTKETVGDTLSQAFDVLLKPTPENSAALKNLLDLSSPWERHTVDKKEDQVKTRMLLDMAQKLVELAEEYGYELTMEQKLYYPPSMGHNWTAVQLHKKRDVYTQTTYPDSIMRSNPGNIEYGSDWKGMKEREPKSNDRYATFYEATSGIRAIALTLLTYYKQRDIRTIRDAITRYAPPGENDTEAYIEHVSKVVGVESHVSKDFTTYEVLFLMVSAIIRMESGEGPVKSVNSWYHDAIVTRALALAEVTPEGE